MENQIIIDSLKRGEKFTGQHGAFSGIVTPLKVDRDSNELTVNCEVNGSTWNEVWDLKHVIWGFKREEYTFLPL